MNRIVFASQWLRFSNRFGKITSSVCCGLEHTGWNVVLLCIPSSDQPPGRQHDVGIVSQVSHKMNDHFGKMRRYPRGM
jgi:hypothetical protein